METKKEIELVFATHNLNKLKEIQAMLPSNIKLLSLDDIGVTEEIPETSDTIEGNAILKAEYVKNRFGYDCFADDTGLEVDALNGAPGVHSARYAGKEKDNEANIQKLLKELEGKENRRARFITVIALNMEDHQLLFTGVCNGSILKEKKGGKGFGYDPVFKPDGVPRSFAEMDMEEKSRLSHRGQAVKNLVEYLSND